jgi:hypothetical protein
MEIDRRTYIERTDAILHLAKMLQLHTRALEKNTEAINRSTNFA